MSEPKVYTHTQVYKEHILQPVVSPQGGICGKCPFAANHPIHIKSERPIYALNNPNASWNNPK